MKERSDSMALPISSLWTMSPASAELSTRSCTSVSIRREPVSPRIAISSTGRSSADRIPARSASSMSWLMYATRSTMRTIFPSSLSGSTVPVCLRMPSRTSHVRLRPRPSRSRCSTTRSECSLWRKPLAPRSRSSSSSACSPACPKGGWPRSWPSPIASSRSSLRRRARATPRAIPVVSSVCVSRVRKWSPSGSTKTCVLCRRRRKAFEWTIRSRSRWNGVRRRHSSSEASRPRVSYERTASGESHCSSCSRTESAKPTATCPAICGIRRSAYPARRRAGSGPNVDTGAVRLRRRPADQPVVVCGSGSRRLGGAICAELGVQPTAAETMRFGEGTIFVRLHENVRGRDVYVVQSTIYPANDNVVELLFWLDACRRASAASVTAVVPYFSYGKGDKKDEPRVSIRALVLADAIEVAGADRVVTMDLHAPQIQGFFRVPVDDLYAMPILAEAIRRAGATDSVVVSPDSGYAKMARRFARRLGAGFALADKTRPGHDEEVEVFGLLGDVAGRDAVLVDDFVASGGTLVEAAERLVERGARSVIAAATHGLFSGDAAAKLAASPIQRVIVTDSVENHPNTLGDKLQLVSVPGLFAEAIKRIHGRESISVLFRDG